MWHSSVIYFWQLGFCVFVCLCFFDVFFLCVFFSWKVGQRTIPDPLYHIVVYCSSFYGLGQLLPGIPIESLGKTAILLQNYQRLFDFSRST